jgi:FeS assembly SUF system regulator
MIRISKLTDYGILLLTQLSAEGATARDLAKDTGVPLPTVAKILKLLAKHDLLEGSRGSQGGYRLGRPPGEITIAQVVEALEGPIALTECAGDTHTCGLEATCPVRGNWNRINRAVFAALSGLTLAEMSRPLPRAWQATEVRR